MKRVAMLTFLMALTCSVAVAQKKGDVIYGRIYDKEGPIVGANVTERNCCDRIMAHTKTDINGEFSFRLVNPRNRIVVKFTGYEIVDVPIVKNHFELKMSDISEIPQSDIITDFIQDVIQWYGGTPEWLLPPAPKEEKEEEDVDHLLQGKYYDL